MPLSFGLLIDNPAANWLYQSEPEPGTANRTIPVPRGKLLGGSSSINGLVWVRGQPLDFDTWAQMGCRGWSWHDVAPVFTRIENFVDGDGSNGRGTGGPLKVSTVPDQNPLYDALFAAAKAAGFKLNPDYNSEDQEGVVKTQTSIYKGRRMSVAHCYIEPAMKRSPNLHVVTDAITLRVLLEGKRCVGVEYEKDGKVVQARGTRDHPVGRRRRQPADPRALRHRPARAAEAARHRGEARAAGGRREFPRPHQRPHHLAA